MQHGGLHTQTLHSSVLLLRFISVVVAVVVVTMVVVAVSTTSLIFVLVFLRFGVVLMVAARPMLMLLRFGLWLLLLFNSFLELVPCIFKGIRTDLTINMLMLADMMFFVAVALANIAQIGVLVVLLTLLLHNEVIYFVSDFYFTCDWEEVVAVGFVAVGLDGGQFERGVLD